MDFAAGSRGSGWRLSKRGFNYSVRTIAAAVCSAALLVSTVPLDNRRRAAATTSGRTSGSAASREDQRSISGDSSRQFVAEVVVSTAWDESDATPLEETCGPRGAAGEACEAE